MLCKDDQLQPVAQPHTEQLQTNKASKETEGHVNMVEMTIQMDTQVVKAEKDLPDISEVTSGQDCIEIGQTEDTVKETSMDLGKSGDHACHEFNWICQTLIPVCG